MFRRGHLCKGRGAATVNCSMSESSRSAQIRLRRQRISALAEIELGVLYDSAIFGPYVYPENSYNCNSKLRKKLQQFSRPLIIRHTLCLQSRTIYHHDTNVSTILISIYKLVLEIMCPVINSAIDFLNKLTVFAMKIFQSVQFTQPFPRFKPPHKHYFQFHVSFIPSQKVV